jgi:hypothetical protein
MQKIKRDQLSRLYEGLLVHVIVKEVLLMYSRSSQEVWVHMPVRENKTSQLIR